MKTEELENLQRLYTGQPVAQSDRYESNLAPVHSQVLQFVEVLQIRQCAKVFDRWKRSGGLKSDVNFQLKLKLLNQIRIQNSFCQKLSGPLQVRIPTAFSNWSDCWTHCSSGYRSSSPWCRSIPGSHSHWKHFCQSIWFDCSAVPDCAAPSAYWLPWVRYSTDCGWFFCWTEFIGGWKKIHPIRSGYGIVIKWAIPTLITQT